MITVETHITGVIHEFRTRKTASRRWKNLNFAVLSFADGPKESYETKKVKKYTAKI